VAFPKILKKIRHMDQIHIENIVLSTLNYIEIFYVNVMQSWGSSVSIVSDYRLGDRGSIPAEAKDFPLASVSRPALRPTHSPVQWVPGVVSGGKMRLGRDTDHTPI
jgi:hypothetical protein